MVDPKLEGVWASAHRVCGEEVEWEDWPRNGGGRGLTPPDGDRR